MRLYDIYQKAIDREITGVIKEVNKFSFILFLKGCFVLIFLLVSVLDCDKSCVLKLLVER